VTEGERPPAPPRAAGFVAQPATTEPCLIAEQRGAT
jgi:hypothetical protein